MREAIFELEEHQLIESRSNGIHIWDTSTGLWLSIQPWKCIAGFMPYYEFASPAFQSSASQHHILTMFATMCVILMYRTPWHHSRSKQHQNVEVTIDDPEPQA